MKFKWIIFIILICSLCCWGKGKYNVILNPGKSSSDKIKILTNDYTLFILDYSNSMNEYLLEKSKYEMLLESMKYILSRMSDNNKIGLRLYGQRWGSTPLDACRATSLVVPINSGNIQSISSALSKYKPRGMTPITYSLKQAVQKDFKGLEGEKHIILITDGGENCDESPCKYAMELIKHRQDIKIDVIAFNIDNQADLDQLECVAKVTSGKMYNADTKADLKRSLDRAFKSKKQVDAVIIGE